MRLVGGSSSCRAGWATSVGEVPGFRVKPRPVAKGRAGVRGRRWQDGVARGLCDGGEGEAGQSLRAGVKAVHADGLPGAAGGGGTERRGRRVRTDRTSVFETGSARLTAVFVDGLLVGADDGLGKVAPEMAGCGLVGFRFREGLVRGGVDVKFFGSKMLAEAVHGAIRLGVGAGCGG
mgnify:CR=1 FL=1